MTSGRSWTAWRWMTPFLLASVLVLVLGTQSGCGERWRRWKNRNEPKPRPRQVTPTVERDTPAPARSMLNAHARLLGTTATRASGIGFVVGLDGTGGLPMPEQIAAHLEREMMLMGIGKSGAYKNTPIAGMTPRQLLADKNTAAVIVEAALPPGARKGSRFDIYVKAINATSLEGGRLWTTELRPGPPSAYGSRQSRVVGEAGGPVYINPFADTGNQTAGVVQTVGRVLDGGMMSEDLEIEVYLDTPSHARARSIASSVNSAFPAGDGDRGATARGRDENLVSVQIPHRYRTRRAEFVQALRHLTLDPTLWEAYARRYASTLKAQPYLANEMAWGLEGLGERALPFVRELYDYAETTPRLLALRTGAHLNDPMCVPYLIAITEGGSDADRATAARLLARIDSGPKVDMALRRLMDEQALTVRVAAYEGLTERGVRHQRRRLESMQSKRGGDAIRLSRARLEAVSRLRLSRGTLQGVQRDVIGGDFLLDQVPGGDPLVYVTQQGEPRIALFGDDVSLRTPLLVSMWGDRLMLSADGPGDPVRLYYRDEHTGRRVVEKDVPAGLGELIGYLAHEPTPEDSRPGLGLSYPDVVGVLYALFKQGGMTAAFATEQDRLLAELLAAGESNEVELRAEGPDDAEAIVVFDEFDRTTTQPTRPTRKGLLVPLGPQPSEEGGESPSEEQPVGDDLVDDSKEKQPTEMRPE